MYVFGGEFTNASPEALQRVYRYDIAMRVWTDNAKTDTLTGPGGRPCRPPSLKFHSAVCHNGKMYVFGGATGSERKKELWMYHLGMDRSFHTV